MVFGRLGGELVGPKNNSRSILADHAALDLSSLACGSIDAFVLETFSTFVHVTGAGKRYLEMVSDLLNGCKERYISRTLFYDHRLFVCRHVIGVETFSIRDST